VNVSLRESFVVSAEAPPKNRYPPHTMLMVVFGAGASFDCIPEANLGLGMMGQKDELRPPLTDGLFDLRRRLVLDAAQDFDTQGALIMELRAVVSAAEGSVEEELQRHLARAEKGDENMRRGLLALRYFIRQVVSRSTSAWAQLAGQQTNYRSLLAKIDRQRMDAGEEVLLVTFNYDLLLETALRFQLGIDKNHIDTYPTGTYKVIKPHGSTDWLRVVTTIEEHQPRDVIASGIIPPDDSAIVRSGDTNAQPGWIPALAVPTVSKSSFECPPTHEKALIDLLPYVDRLLTIGWRGQEKTFLDLCAKHLRSGLRGLVVSSDPGSAKTIALHLRDAFPDSMILPSSSSGFSHSLRSDRTVDAAWAGEGDA
jgi:hypothetical protein